MIPTWTDHAAELGRCVRKTRTTFVTSTPRYVAHFYATLRMITSPKPRSKP